MRKVKTKSFLAVTVAVSAVAFGGPMLAPAHATTTNTDVIFTVRNSSVVLELTVPSAVYLNLMPTSGSDFNTASLNVSVGTNNPTGYNLSMTADSDALTRTSSIIDPASGDPYTPTILPMLTTASSTGYTAAQFESSSTDAYTLNRWGYKLSSDTNFMPMTTTSIPLAETDAASNIDTTTIDFAAKVDSTVAAGTYQTTLNFTAVTNAVPISNIADLTYMQEFATLTSSELADVLASMTVGAQYQLKDNRDEKPYYISKLADGNVWMTQNLDHDIKTDGTVTYDNTTTDLGWNGSSYSTASWSPSTATYATGTTTWNGSYTTWNGGYTAPESYDPGDLCWNGTPDDDTTVSCSQNGSHYHRGNFYNWTAAVAMNNSSSFTANGTDVDQSICPAGWTLPKDGSTAGSGSFQYLVSQYGWDNSSYGMTGDYQMWDAPLYFPLSGLWHGELSGVGYWGYYWSSVVDDGDYGYAPRYYFNGYVDPADIDGRDGLRFHGISIRCVAR